MLKIELNGHELQVPTSTSEIKLSQYIEWNRLRQIFYEVQKTGIKHSEFIAAANCLQQVMEIPQEVIDDLTIGGFSDEDKEDTLGKLFFQVDSTVMSYEIPALQLEGYKFTHNNERWVFPCYFDHSGKPWTSLRYGQYVEAMNAVKMLEEQKENDKDGSLEFTKMLMLISSLCRPEKHFKMVDGRYEYVDTETAFQMRTAAEKAAYFQDVSMQVGMDIDFFFQHSILS